MLNRVAGHSYLKDCSPLPLEEEAALVAVYLQTHDPRVEARLVRSHLRLVAHIARSLRVPEAEREDVLQEGNLGLVQAVRRYDPKLGKLSSYAGWWIRAYQMRYLISIHRLVKIGTTQAQRWLFFRLGRARDSSTRAS